MDISNSDLLSGDMSLFQSAYRDMPLSKASFFQTEEEALFLFGTECPFSDLAKPLADTFPTLVSQHKAAVLSVSGECQKPKGKRIAVLFSGGPASGGHNVLVGLFETLGRDNTLFGVKAGPKGLLAGDIFPITASQIAAIKNTGGFDFLGSDRTKIKDESQFQSVEAVVKDARLDGLVIIGGDDSNTNAAFLAERLAPLNCTVVGVPKTIDGDLQAGSYIPISFGFDTATKIYAEMVGNILKDTPSSRKYWHFVKLMGRDASHVALEVALQTHATITLISEEMASFSLSQIVDYLVSVILERQQKGLHYGVVLIPEGLVEFIPELKKLIAELNQILSDNPVSDGVLNQLTHESASVFSGLPVSVKDILLSERDSHGNLKVSQIPTETLIVSMVSDRLKDTAFAYNTHFFGYEGRCGAPTLFDAYYGYHLGIVAANLVLQGYTGYMAAVGQFDTGFRPYAVSLISQLHLELRHQKPRFYIKKTLVDLDSPAFHYFKARRDEWAKSDVLPSPGPRQLWGPVANQLPFSVVLNQAYSSLLFSL